MADPASQLTLSQENNLLNLLHEAAEELRGLLQPAKAREETDHRDSAGLHTRLFQILRMFYEVQTQRVCVLREVLCGTANTLTGLRMCSNLTHTFPDRETQEKTADVGKCFMRGLGSSSRRLRRALLLLLLIFILLLLALLA